MAFRRLGIPCRARVPVKRPIGLRIAQNDLHVFARLGEWNRIHKLRGVSVALPGTPTAHPILSRIVGGERGFKTSPELHQARQIDSPKAEIVTWINQARP